MQGTLRFFQSVLSAADFPTEILSGIPVVEIHGDKEATVLHHRGVLAYGEDEIAIASDLGPVRVSGSKLVLFRMNRERIVIHGSVRAVTIGAEEAC